MNIRASVGVLIKLIEPVFLSLRSYFNINKCLVLYLRVYSWSNIFFLNFNQKARVERTPEISECLLNFTCTKLFLLTYSMEQSPSEEANRFSASQEIPHVLWKQKVITGFTSARRLSLS